MPYFKNAPFRDYGSGYCCECKSGYYGNGKDCLKSGKSQPYMYYFVANPFGYVE